MSEYLNKIVYLTQAQYDTLKSGTAVGTETAINSSNIYVTDDVLGNSTDVAAIKTELGLGDAAFKGVDSSIGAASSSTALPTSAAVATFVEGKGYLTSATDNKVLQGYKPASDYSYWRPLLIGYSAGSASSFTPSDQTNQCYTFKTLLVQPSTGTIKAGIFDGSGESLTSLNASNVSSGSLGVAYGGTDISSYTTGDIIYASGSTTLSKLSGNTTTTNKFLRSVAATSGTAAAPTWAAVTATDVGLGNVENTKLSTWTGSTALTTLGTISTGTWQGTAIGSSYVGNLPASKITSGTIAVAQGGTNIGSYTIGDILYASASTTLSKLGGNTTTTRKFLRSVASTSGTAVAPAWDTVTKTDVGLGDVENTKLSTWTGSTYITTLGTIGSGTWQGTAIGSSYVGDLPASKITSGQLPVAYGGTGASDAAGARTNLGAAAAVHTHSQYITEEQLTEGLSVKADYITRSRYGNPIEMTDLRSRQFSLDWHMEPYTNYTLQQGSGTPSSSNIRNFDGISQVQLIWTHYESGELTTTTTTLDIESMYGEKLYCMYIRFDSDGYCSVYKTGEFISSYAGETLTAQQQWLCSQAEFGNGNPPTGSQVVNPYDDPNDWYNESDFGEYLGLSDDDFGTYQTFEVKYKTSSNGSWINGGSIQTSYGADPGMYIEELVGGVSSQLSDITNILNYGTGGYFLQYNSTNSAPEWVALTKTHVGLSEVENTKLSTWTGANTITTVGTISTGTWQGTSIKVGYGGTGTTTAPTKGGIIYASSTSAYASTGAGSSGQLLVSGGTGAPSWSSGLNYSASDATLTISTTGSNEGFAIDTSGYRYSYIRFMHSGTTKGFIRYDAGNATNITTASRFGFMEYSPNTTANASTTGSYEAYYLPRPSAGLSSNQSYYILTTKGFSLSGTTLTITTNPDP